MAWAPARSSGRLIPYRRERAQRMNEGEKRQGRRVKFDNRVPARMMGIDGTWQRECIVEDISDGGAKLHVSGSIGNPPLQEFFLVLSSTGLAYRHCRLV